MLHFKEDQKTKTALVQKEHNIKLKHEKISEKSREELESEDFNESREIDSTTGHPTPADNKKTKYKMHSRVIIESRDEISDDSFERDESKSSPVPVSKKSTIKKSVNKNMTLSSDSFDRESSTSKQNTIKQRTLKLPFNMEPTQAMLDEHFNDQTFKFDKTLVSDIKQTVVKSSGVDDFSRE